MKLFSFKPIYLVLNVEDKTNQETTTSNDQNNNNLASSAASTSLFNMKLNQNLISYNSLNATINRSFVLPHEYLTQNYALINNYLFDLNQTKVTNLHNYSRFTNFDLLNVTQPPSLPSHHMSIKLNNNVNIQLTRNIENYYQFIENNYRDNYAIKTFFLNELNANLFLYKRLLTNMKDMKVKQDQQQQQQQQQTLTDEAKHNDMYTTPHSYLYKYFKFNEIYTHLTSPQIIGYLVTSSNEAKLNDWRDSLIFSHENEEKPSTISTGN